MRVAGVRIRGVLSAAATTAALALAACGGGEAESAKVGDCIDAEQQVVDCESSDAVQTLVTDQEAPDAIACLEIGDLPQTEVTVGDGTFCAEDLEP